MPVPRRNTAKSPVSQYTYTPVAYQTDPKQGYSVLEGTSKAAKK